MRKVLVLGSICAVLILVFASLSPVVGFQKVKTESNESPLFKSRINKIAKYNDNGLTCQYINQEESPNIYFPVRDSYAKIKNWILTNIKNIDFNKIKRNSKDIDNNKLEELIQNDFDFSDITSSEYYTICNWRLGCIAESIIRWVIGTIAVFCIATTILSILIFHKYDPLFTIF